MKHLFSLLATLAIFTSAPELAEKILKKANEKDGKGSKDTVKIFKEAPEAKAPPCIDPIKP